MYCMYNTIQQQCYFSKLPVPKHSSSAAMYPTSPRSFEGFLVLAVLLLLPPGIALHHMQLPRVHWVNRRDSSVPLTVTNGCGDDIYPGIQTQGGTAPPSSGFLLKPGA